MSNMNGQSMSILDSNQEDLLTAALNSNNPNHKNMGLDLQFNTNLAHLNGFAALDGTDPLSFMNQDSLAATGFGVNGESLENTPFLDKNEFDDNFDYDFNDADGTMIGELPGEEDQESDEHHTDIHDKRKISNGDKDDNHDAKRREGEVKEPKKPGRKPLTSEPTNKRKAQNRAAQRAFRERKEKHLKDLETKVEELEKVSESATQENSLLRAQVDRLQIELREYRKRMSMQSGLITGPSLMSGNPFMPNGATNLATPTNGLSDNFQFDFPKFGTPQVGLHNNRTAVSKSVDKPNHNQGTLARAGSGGRSISPRSQQRANGSISATSPTARNRSISSHVGISNGGSTTTSFTPVADMGVNGEVDFTNWITTTTSAEPESTASVPTNSNRIFQFKGSTSTASPESSSSASQYMAGSNSSCGTSPAPSHHSPPNKTLDNHSGDGLTAQSTDGETSFCDQLNMACGTIRNPIPRTKSLSDGTSGAPIPKLSPSNSVTTTGFGNFASQNGGGFDPQLFDTYREPQTAVIGDGDFTGGFFNDALPNMGFTGPFGWASITAPTGLTPAYQKSNPLEMADALASGLDVVKEEEEVVPADQPGSFMTCHKIWDKLQERPDFKDGSLDIDNLCSELRAKARCSESGVVVDAKDVDSALERALST